MERLIQASNLVYDSATNMVQLVLKDLEPDEAFMMGLCECPNLFRGSLLLGNLQRTSLGSLLKVKSLNEENSKLANSEIVLPESLAPSHPLHYTLNPLRKLKSFAMVNLTENQNKGGNERKTLALQTPKTQNSSKDLSKAKTEKIASDKQEQQLLFVFEEFSSKLNEMRVDKYYKHGDVTNKRIVGLLSEVIQKAFRKNVSFSHETFQNQEVYAVVLSVLTEKIAKGIINNKGIHTCKCLLAAHVLQKIAPKLYKEWFSINSNLNEEKEVSSDIRVIQEFCIGKNDFVKHSFCPNQEEPSLVQEKKKDENSADAPKELIRKEDKSENESETGKSTHPDSRLNSNFHELSQNFENAQENLVPAGMDLPNKENTEKNFEIDIDASFNYLEDSGLLHQGFVSPILNFGMEEELILNTETDFLGFSSFSQYNAPDPKPDAETQSQTQKGTESFQVAQKAQPEPMMIEPDKAQVDKAMDECSAFEKKLSITHPKQDLIKLKRKIEEEPYYDITIQELFQKALSSFSADTLRQFVFRLSNYLTLMEENEEFRCPFIKILVFPYSRNGLGVVIYKLIHGKMVVMSGQRNLFDQPKFECFKVTCEMLMKVLEPNLRVSQILKKIIIDDFSCLVPEPQDPNKKRKAADPLVGIPEDEEKFDRILSKLKKKKAIFSEGGQQGGKSKEKKKVKWSCEKPEIVGSGLKSQRRPVESLDPRKRSQKEKDKKEGECDSACQKEQESIVELGKRTGGFLSLSEELDFSIEPQKEHQPHGRPQTNQNKPIGLQSILSCSFGPSDSSSHQNAHSFVQKEVKEDKVFAPSLDQRDQRKIERKGANGGNTHSQSHFHSIPIAKTSSDPRKRKVNDHHPKEHQTTHHSHDSEKHRSHHSHFRSSPKASLRSRPDKNSRYSPRRSGKGHEKKQETRPFEVIIEQPSFKTPKESEKHKEKSRHSNPESQNNQSENTEIYTFLMEDENPRKDLEEGEIQVGRKWKIMNEETSGTHQKDKRSSFEKGTIATQKASHQDSNGTLLGQRRSTLNEEKNENGNELLQSQQFLLNYLAEFQKIQKANLGLPMIMVKEVQDGSNSQKQQWFTFKEPQQPALLFPTAPIPFLNQEPSFSPHPLLVPFIPLPPQQPSIFPQTPLPPLNPHRTNTKTQNNQRTDTSRTSQNSQILDQVPPQAKGERLSRSSYKYSLEKPQTQSLLSSLSSDRDSLKIQKETIPFYGSSSGFQPTINPVMGQLRTNRPFENYSQEHFHSNKSKEKPFQFQFKESHYENRNEEVLNDPKGSLDRFKKSDSFTFKGVKVSQSAQCKDPKPKGSFDMVQLDD